MADTITTTVAPIAVNSASANGSAIAEAPDTLRALNIVRRVLSAEATPDAGRDALSFLPFEARKRAVTLAVKAGGDMETCMSLLAEPTPVVGAKTITFHVGEAGGISVYGLQMQPVTLYLSQWEVILGLPTECKPGSFGEKLYRFAAHWQDKLEHRTRPASKTSPEKKYAARLSLDKISLVLTAWLHNNRTVVATETGKA